MAPAQAQAVVREWVKAGDKGEKAHSAPEAEGNVNVRTAGKGETTAVESPAF